MTNEALRERMLSEGDSAGEGESRPVEGAPAHDSVWTVCQIWAFLNSLYGNYTDYGFTTYIIFCENTHNNPVFLWSGYQMRSV